MYRIVAVLMIAVTGSGCSKAVEIPRDDIEDAKYREPGSYRIRLKGHEEYLVGRFSVTDSTVVIEELLPADERYRLERASLPLALPTSEVESIAVMKLNKRFTYGLVGGAIFLIGLIIWVDSMDWSID